MTSSVGKFEITSNNMSPTYHVIPEKSPFTIKRPSLSPIVIYSIRSASSESIRYEAFSVRWILSRRFFKWNCKHFANKPDWQRFSGKNGLKSGEKNQCLWDSWSICRLRVWIAPFRDSRYRAAGVRLCVTFCGLAGCRPIPWSAKVHPAYRASNIPPKTAENTKTPRTMRPVNAQCGVFVQLCGFRQIHDPGG